MNTQDSTETTENIENMDAVEATTHETVEGVETVESEQADAVEALPQSERSENHKPHRELSWFAWIAISVIGLTILVSVLVSLLINHDQRIDRNVNIFTTSPTGTTCVKEHWKLTNGDVKASEDRGMDAIGYYKAKNPNAKPDRITSCS